MSGDAVATRPGAGPEAWRESDPLPASDMPAIKSAGVPQSERFVPHVAHTPRTQVPPGPQLDRQPPQFAGSVSVLTQPPPQSVPPLGHVQIPAMHVVPPLQRVLHVPQFIGSLVRSAQVCVRMVPIPGPKQTAWFAAVQTMMH